MSLFSTPRFPDDYIIEFTRSIGPSTLDGLQVAGLFGKMGMASKSNLDALQRFLLEDRDKARDVMLNKGLSFLQWMVVRQRLLVLADASYVPAEGYSFLKHFLASCKPPLEQHIGLFIDMHISTEDLRVLSRVPGFRPAVGNYFMSIPSGFTLLEYLGFKCRLHLLARSFGYVHDIQPSTAFRSHLTTALGFGGAGFNLEAGLNALISAGLETVEEMETLRDAPLGQFMQVLNKLCSNGMSYVDGRAIELKLRGGVQSS